MDKYNTPGWDKLLWCCRLFCLWKCSGKNEWKIVTYFNKSYGELYNLKKDKWEKNNLWNNKKFEVSEPEDLERVDLDQDLIGRLEQSEKEQLFYKHFDLLGEQCRKIMMWFFDKTALSEIAKRLDTTENYIKKRKFVCKEKLVKAIQNDPSFSELKN